jgi:hypothetical protein
MSAFRDRALAATGAPPSQFDAGNISQCSA